MSKMINFVMFALGVTVGAVAAYRYAKAKYEKIAQEEIDSVKRIYHNKDSKAEDVSSDKQKEDKTTKATEYANVLSNNGYTNYSNTEKKEQTSGEGKPYVISPDEFGEFDEFETISLTYYADQILADENDELVEDAEDTVGFESLSHFGEYEDDSVFVRNERLKCDYEILLDQRTYSEVVKSKPHRTEV